MTDEQRVEFLAEHCEHISVSSWLVQLCVNKHWYTAYFKQPLASTPKTLHASKLDAWRAVVDEAMMEASKI